MKTCLICATDNEVAAATCAACGEGSFAAEDTQTPKASRQQKPVEPVSDVVEETDETDDKPPSRSTPPKRRH